MKKQLLLAFILPFFAFNSIESVRVELDDRVSVEFPETPEEKTMNGNQVWVSDVGSDARCMVMVLDFAKFGMDSAAVADEMSREESFRTFKDGILGEMEGATLISEQKTTTLGYTTFAYHIDMGKTDTEALNVMYNRNVFIGRKMYSLSFYEKPGKPNADKRNHFFKSFKAR